MTAASEGNVGVRSFVSVWRLGSKGLLLLAVLVAGGAFSLQLSGLDPHAPVGPQSASLKSEIAFGGAFLVIGLFGAGAWPRLASLLKADAIILALPVLALLSTTWAPDPGVAFRRAAAFAATVLSGFAIAASSPGDRSFRFIARTVAIALVLSIVYVALSPTYGLHQATDGAQSVHAGDWRGLFIHRTTLGRLAALSLAIAIYSQTDGLGLLPRVGVIAASLLCLLMARSGGGYASAVILLATPPVLKAFQIAARRSLVIAAGLAASGGLLAVLAAPILAPLILNLLGKDATLTGRTEVWRLMLQAAGERPFFGYGYSTGFREVVARLVASHSAYGYVPNAQNGYLDVVLNLGLVGLVMALLTMALGFWRAIRLAVQPQGPLLPLLVMVFIAETNLVEAALISANDVFVLIYITALAASGEALRTPER